MLPFLELFARIAQSLQSVIYYLQTLILLVLTRVECILLGVSSC